MTKNEKMTKQELSINIWVYFCYNYPPYEEIIEYICNKTGKRWLIEHFKEKFDGFYDAYGPRAVMETFYCSLGSQDLRSALIEYALKVYGPKGMNLSDEQLAMLNED